MSKLDVNPEIRYKIAQEIRLHRNMSKAKTKYEADKVATKKRGNDIRDSIEDEKLLSHSDKLYYEELLEE